MEVNIDEGYITFYNKEDIKAIANEEQDDKFEDKCNNMKIHTSILTNHGSTFVRIRKI